jgi:magnesium chelatase family protein
MHFQESLEASQIYSLRGLLDDRMPFIVERPFRHIHHTASSIAIIGGGPHMLPGEISLAHRGVLFLDEVAEFPRNVLDTLRQPMEEKQVHISRAAGTLSYPCGFLLLGAMNPCVCGYYGDTEKQCSCSLTAVKNYQHKISGPLLDRIDIVMQLSRDSSSTQSSMSAVEINLRISTARDMQKKRYAGTPYYSNADLKAGDISIYIVLDAACQGIIQRAQEKLGLSMRIVHKTMKIARSVADFEGSEEVKVEHVMEALQMRSDRRLLKTTQ